MTLPSRERWRVPDLPPVTIVSLLGMGTVLLTAGMISTQPILAATGGVAAGLALVLLSASAWLDLMVLLVLTLPLPALYRQEEVRVAPVVAVTAAAVMGWLMRRALHRRPAHLGGIPLQPAIVLLGAVALSATFALQKVAAVRETFSIALLLAFLFMATDTFVREPRRVRMLALTLTAVAGISGVLAAAQALGAFPSAFPMRGSPLQRATLGFNWPNELGMFMGLSLPLCAYAVQSAKTRTARFLATVCLAAGIVGLVSTFSRGSWLAVVASAVVLLPAGHWRYAARTALIAAVAAAAVELVSGGVISARLTSELGGNYVDQRAALMLAGLFMFQAHPILGVGPGGFAIALDEYGPGIAWLWDYIGSAHNAYIHMAAETGAVGLAALLLFFGAGLFTLIRAARRLRRDGAPRDDIILQRALLWSFAVAASMGLVEWVFAHGVGELVMLVAAMGFSLERATA